MTSKSSYWGYALLTLLLGVLAFWGFKEVLPDTLFPELTDSKADHIVVDEMMKKAMQEADTSSSEEQKEGFGAKKDSIVAAKKEVEEDPELPNQLLAEDYSQAEASFYLDHFYERLDVLEKNPKETKVRIAYFGDSMTDGDLIVQDIRQFFQSRFGGSGVGFVPITSESARSRISVIHRFSPDWKMYSYMKSYDDAVPPFGVHGDVFYAVDSLAPNYVRYSAGQNRKNRLIPRPTLYYGRAKNDSAQVRAVIDEDTVTYRLKPTQLLNTLRLSDRSLTNLQIDFYNADSIPFYGVNMDTPFGIQVDNFSNRGNSGLPLSQLNTSLMHAFQNSEIHYDLIILQYGTNVLSAGRTEYGWYGVGMGRVIRHLRKAFPGTSILIVSIADRSQKYDNEMKTDSAVVPLLKVQKAFATKEKTGFINLYELMGGRGSMVDWVEGEPPRANKDYTHFNPRGAKEVAGLIFDQLATGFKAYKEQMEKKKIEAEKKARQQRDSTRRDSLQKIREMRKENHKAAENDRDSLQADK